MSWLEVNLETLAHYFRYLDEFSISSWPLSSFWEVGILVVVWNSYIYWLDIEQMLGPAAFLCVVWISTVGVSFFKKSFFSQFSFISLFLYWRQAPKRGVKAPLAAKKKPVCSLSLSTVCTRTKYACASETINSWELKMQMFIDYAQFLGLTCDGS